MIFRKRKSTCPLLISIFISHLTLISTSSVSLHEDYSTDRAADSSGPTLDNRSVATAAQPPPFSPDDGRGIPDTRSTSYEYDYRHYRGDRSTGLTSGVVRQLYPKSNHTAKYQLRATNRTRSRSTEKLDSSKPNNRDRGLRIQDYTEDDSTGPEIHSYAPSNVNNSAAGNNTSSGGGKVPGTTTTPVPSNARTEKGDGAKNAPAPAVNKTNGNPSKPSTKADPQPISNVPTPTQPISNVSRSLESGNRQGGNSGGTSSNGSGSNSPDSNSSNCKNVSSNGSNSNAANSSPTKSDGKNCTCPPSPGPTNNDAPSKTTDSKGTESKIPIPNNDELPGVIESNDLDGAPDETKKLKKPKYSKVRKNKTRPKSGRKGSKKKKEPNLLTQIWNFFADTFIAIVIEPLRWFLDLFKPHKSSEGKEMDKA